MRNYLDVVAGLAFMFAAAAPITTAPQYRPSPPIAANDVVIVIIGCAAILVFGIILIMMWNHVSARASEATRSRPGTGGS